MTWEVYLDLSCESRSRVSWCGSSVGRDAFGQGMRRPRYPATHLTVLVSHTSRPMGPADSALLRTIRVRNTPLGTVSNKRVRNIALREWCVVPALRSILLVMWCAESQAWSEKNGQPGSSLSIVNQSALEISNVSLTNFSELGQPKSTFCIVNQSALDNSNVNETVWLSQIEIAGPMKKDTVNQFSFDK